MLATVYTDRRDGGIWYRLVRSGRLRGILNVVLGSVLVLTLLLPYLANMASFLDVSADPKPLERLQPPDWSLLALWLDNRPTAKSEPGNPFATRPRARPETDANGSPRAFHPLGTDSAGRDLFSYIILGAHSAFLPGLYAVFLSLGLGCLFGVLWGYYGGWRSSLVQAIIKIVHSIPRLFLLLVVGAASNFGIYSIMTALGIVSFPKISELIRGRILSLEKQEFITAAREVGMGDLAILVKHILWYNCRHILFIQASFGMADAVLTETTLSYLGFGAQASWGQMVATGDDYLFNGELWASAVPAIAVVMTITGFCLIGDGLSRIFKLKS